MENFNHKIAHGSANGIFSLLNIEKKHRQIRKSQLNPLCEIKKEIADKMKEQGISEIQHGGSSYKLAPDVFVFDIASFANDYPEIYSKYLKKMQHQEIIISK